MTVKIQAPKAVLQESIRTISSVIQGDDEDMPMDLNMVADPDNGIELYVRKFNNLQVLHKITSGDNIDIDVERRKEFVFSSEILESLIQNSDSARVNLEFDSNDFTLYVDDGWFSEPAEFKLPLFQDSEFEDSIELEEYHYVTSVKCSQLRSTLRMMSTISPVFEVSLSDNIMQMTVHDAVQGEGEITKRIDPVEEISSINSKFEVRPVETFLKRMSSDKEVDIQLSTNENMMIQSELENWTSQLVLSNKI